MIDPLTGAVGTALGGVVGAGISAFGTSAANKANIALSREQMQWQERMSNTAYQRSFEDMRKAGLNPILTAGSPAPMPSPTPAQAQNPGAAFQNLGATMASSARTYMDFSTYLMTQIKQAAEIEAISADISQTKAQTNLINTNAKSVGYGLPQLKAHARMWEHDFMQKYGPYISSIFSEGSSFLKALVPPFLYGKGAKKHFFPMPSEREVSNFSNRFNKR